MKPIIEVKHVWKEYQKGIDRRYKSLRDTITSIPGRIFGEEKEKFWALEDIDFRVDAGESLGIIGKNGAGKSTLLKILSRITPPTKGEIVLRGRVASLLEVGTGFHPELTGRENIFFNGSILGMKNQEIKRKFDEIVDFSGVESFIDTPLKHYSSGMQMRLAFSVAAHLESEILLIDEVLAVGDAEFQKKCIGKMDDVSKGEGKTILFVSHDMNFINLICNTGLLLVNGQYKVKNSIYDVVNSYFLLTQIEIFPIKFTGNLNKPVYLENIKINNKDILDINNISLDTFINNKIEFYFFSSSDMKIKVYFAVYYNGVRLFTLSDSEDYTNIIGKFVSQFIIPMEILRPNQYTVGIGITDMYQNWNWSRDTFSFKVSDRWNDNIKKENFGIFNVDSLGKRILE